MIEINLLPGAKKARRSKGPSFDFSALTSGALSQIKDPFLGIAVLGLVIGLGGVAAQYLWQGRRESNLNERLEQARRDSTTYDGVLKQMRLAEAQRDSVIRQLSIIRAIDGERYTWPHVLDELSKNLPQYTWITRIQQTSAVPSVVVKDSVPGKGPQRMTQIADAAKKSVAKLTLRVVGETVDVQAITRFWRQLEQSPFIENVNLVGSTTKPVSGADVIEFTLDLQFQRPDSSSIRTVPLNVQVR
jgi:Tfp pilus assembly protein PilN